MSARGDEPAAPKAFAAMDVGDWRRVESSPEFERLVAARRRIVIPSLIVFVLVFGTFTVLAAWDHHFMAHQIVSGFTVAYAFALGLIVMTWLLAFIYIRASNSRIDPLAEAVARLVGARQQAADPDPQRRGGTSPGGEVEP
ncbi:MAG: DUF485 domain-containing protein [Actinomycetota bacterium]|nr:DUF485 domain-containing protein [Actinomycetota bacterium]